MSDYDIAPISTTPAKTATDQIFQTLYDAVVSLKLLPGTKVSEIDIARQLNVSRQPVRDAFFRLSKLGFIAIRPQRATLITKISERAVLDAAFVRTALEVECLRLALETVGPEEIARLRDNLARQKASIGGKDPSVFHALDEEFHATLCSIAGQPHAWSLIQEQKAQMDRVRWLTLTDARQTSVHAEHTAIVDAMEHGNAKEAERQLRLHLGDIRNALVRIRDAHAAYFETSA